MKTLINNFENETSSLIRKNWNENGKKILKI